jgi:hypothetical protein
MDIEDFLNRLLPHRLNALAIAELMIEFRLKWEEPKPMQVFVEGRLQFEGLTNLFTNPILEAGTLHTRALLEFIGLKTVAGHLAELDLKTRKRDDAGIERMTGPNGPLPLVRLRQVQEEYPADPGQAQRALAAVILAANKGMAHSSTSYFSSPTDVRHTLLAVRLAQTLVEKHVYLPLGRRRPPLPIEAWARQ